MHWFCSSCGGRNLGRYKECQTCGDPKDADEKWVMPGDTRAAPTVRDPALLRQASAGADWQCAYCGSHQSRLNDHCAQCGAARAEGSRVPRGGARAAPEAAAPAPTPRSRRSWRWLLLALPAVLALGCVALALPFVLKPHQGAARLEKPVSMIAFVGEQRWRHQVHVERYQIVQEEGFAEARPSDALDVTSLGQRHHHDEQVLDHYETETYEEQVPYQDTETYTEQEQCGQDCTTTPQTCTESCTPGDNGFASCHTTCTGGGQSCMPRYCPVTRTRQVTRYRSETRTRQVPRYRAEPRFAEYFSWRAWRWRPARVIEASGNASEALRWPSDAELAPPEALGEGERERTRREATYTIELRSRAGARTYVARDLEDFERVRAHSRWYVGEDGVSLIKPVPDVTRAPERGTRART